MLQGAYDDATRRLRSALGAKKTMKLCPGGLLDVAERTRFRIRALDATANDSAIRIREALACALERYETTVDAYFSAYCDSLAFRHEAVHVGQVSRKKLEQAKCHLLTKATPGSEAYQRIKRRAVRTRPPTWFVEQADTLKNRIVITITDDGEAHAFAEKRESVGH